MRLSQSGEYERRDGSSRRFSAGTIRSTATTCRASSCGSQAPDCDLGRSARGITESPIQLPDLQSVVLRADGGHGNQTESRWVPMHGEVHRMRPCFICGANYLCEHREGELITIYMRTRREDERLYEVEKDRKVVKIEAYCD